METKQGGAWRVRFLALALLVACRGPGAGPSRESEARASQDAGAPTQQSRDAALRAADASAAIIHDAGLPPPSLPSPADAGGNATVVSPADDHCRSDSDCVLTRLQPGDCCPLLCTPRAVTTAQESAQREACAGFSDERCAQPMCPRPLGVPQAVCRAGRCEVLSREVLE